MSPQISDNETSTKVHALVEYLNRHIREKAILENQCRDLSLEWERTLTGAAKDAIRDRLQALTNDLNLLNATIHCEEHEFELAKVEMMLAANQTMIREAVQIEAQKVELLR